MKRVIMDTNVYGLIVVDLDRNKVKEALKKGLRVIVYGMPLIRKELRDTPKNIRAEGANLRNYLLSLYDEVTGNRTLKYLKEADSLATSYFSVYKELGGYASRDEIIKDIMIFACASMNSLDIVVSNDRKTMLSDKALHSYKIVNQIRKIRMPRFLSYEEFKREIK